MMNKTKFEKCVYTKSFVPTPGMRVRVSCRNPIYSALTTRTGTIVAVGQGRQKDMIVVEFRGYRESFRLLDLRIGEVRMLAV